MLKRHVQGHTVCKATGLMGTGLGFLSIMKPPSPNWLSIAVGPLEQMLAASHSWRWVQAQLGFHTGAYTTVKVGLRPISATCTSKLG